MGASFFLVGALRSFLGLIFISVILGGCASVDFYNYRQTVLVNSNPPGATIYDRGEKIGVTPAFARVRRRYYPQITLALPGQAPQKVDLKSHYRWGDSFGTNFILFGLAPVGWVTDWLTGTAWKMDDPGMIVLPGGNAKPEIQPTKLVAIAPPDVGDVDTADALGPLVEGKLRKADGYTILPYEKTAPLFGYYNSNHGLTENKNLQNNMYRELNVDHVFTSKAEPNADGYSVKGSLRDVYTGKETASVSWAITPADGALKNEFHSQRKIQEYFYILPNTFFLNFSQFNASLKIDESTYKGRSNRGHGFSEDLLNYLSAVSLAHLERPREHVRRQWTFGFVPTFIVSQKRIKFDDYRPLEDVNFERWYVGGGYGIEVGHLSSIGLFYFDYIPLVTWTRLNFRTQDFEETLSRTSITGMSELGYSYFFSSHMIGKIFSRQLNEDGYLWRKALHDITGQDRTITTINSIYFGVAIGYYIPDSISYKSGWKINEKH